jgi:hypothetical protein
MGADVDLDFGNRDKILNLIKNVPARQESNTESKHHNSGVYVTDIPYDPIHGCASIDYKEADQRGYFKLDFLNVSVYRYIKSPEHYKLLLHRDPPWEKLMDRKFCEEVVHIGGHCELIRQMKPDSIQRMAMFLAVIRPAKRHLIGNSWKEISEDIWIKEDGEFIFKKAHAVAYSHLVALHMNMLNEHSLSA